MYWKVGEFLSKGNGTGFRMVMHISMKFQREIQGGVSRNKGIQSKRYLE